MTTPALPDTERLTEYTIAVASVGPYSVGFAIFGDDDDYAQWLEVWDDGVKLTAVTDFTVSSVAGGADLSIIARPITDAQITFTTARSGAIKIVGARRPRQASQFTNGVSVTADHHNRRYTDLMAIGRELFDKFKRVIVAPGGEEMDVLPAAADRASKFAAYDASGNPIATANSVTGTPAVASAIVNDSDVTGTSVADALDNLRQVGVPAGRVRSTNLIAYPYFDSIPWSKELTVSDQISERRVVITSGSAQRNFGYRELQMASVSAAIQSYCPVDAAIDATKSYRVGVWGYASGGGNLNFLVAPTNGDPISTLTVALTLPGTISDASEVASTVNAQGGGAPAWPAGTLAASFGVENANTGTFKHVFAAYAIRSDQLPNTTFTKANAGGGTHEAFWDGTHLFTLSHTYNQMAKFDEDLNRVAVVTTGSYPHDIVQLGADVWVINYAGTNIQQISRSAVTVTNSYTINGSRHGFGIATDGTDLYLGVGDSGLAETPAIVKFNVAGSSQSSLSTDVDGGSSNIPVVFLSGSVWSIHAANSEVKRINPTTGATIATVSCSIGTIYGLGTDGLMIYAQGRSGVAVVDPTGNTLAETYPFTLMYASGGNPRPDASGRMWGCAFNGVWVLDHARGHFSEIPNVWGSPKWLRQITSGMAVGHYQMPTIDVYR